MVWARNMGVSFGGPSLILKNSIINSGCILPGDTSIGVRTAQSNNSIINLQNIQINVRSDFSTSLFGLQAGFPGANMTADHVNIQLNASETNVQAVALLVGNSTTSLTVNDSFILSNSPDGAAYIVGGAAVNTDSIHINRRVLNMNAPTAAIKTLLSGFNVSIDGLSNCFINGVPINCV
ncbi:hypothetical protein [Rickettsiella massiliensis]|uniref:hypothetical protein n=1 Tax=Rickettsiella massiliensis TaxID=676517 RepID=UPI00029ADAD8|nr:hypothetical protein [Rickettsiella massiliensis]